MKQSYFPRDENIKENYKENVKGSNPKETKTWSQGWNSNNKYLYYNNRKRIVL